MNQAVLDLLKLEVNKYKLESVMEIEDKEKIIKVSYYSQPIEEKHKN